MERTYNPEYSVEEEPIVISKHLIDLLKKEQEFPNLFALYGFYYYLAKWQKTNRPKATVEYVSQSMGWHPDKVRRVKRKLKELGLINDIQVRGNGNKVVGCFVQVNFIWNNQKFHPLEKPEPSIQIHPLEKPEGGNIINNINNKYISLPIKKSSSKERNLKYLPLANYLAQIILTKKNMRYTSSQILSWTNPIRQLIETNGVSPQRIKSGLKWYKKNIGLPYVPVIESGTSLRDKFSKLESAMQRDQQGEKKKRRFTDPDCGTYVERDNGKFYHITSGERWSGATPFDR